MSQERRLVARAKIELNVEYKRLNTFFADYTRNISKGGTFIQTDRPLDMGTEFVFALAVRGLEQPLRLRGRVKWVVSTDEVTDDQPAGMGIEFQFADGAERRETEAIVEQLMEAQLGKRLTAKLLGRSASDDDDPDEG